jgi:alpha-galactosidase
MATNDVRRMPLEIAQILLNQEVIAVDQDVLGRQGNRVASRAGVETWLRQLSNGDRAVVLFNRTGRALRTSVIWSEIGGRGHVRDLWKHAEIGTNPGGFDVLVLAHGIAMFRVHADGAH